MNTRSATRFMSEQRHPELFNYLKMIGMNPGVTKVAITPMIDEPTNIDYVEVKHETTS